MRLRWSKRRDVEVVDAVVTCVSYADFLSITLPRNLRQVDDVVVVTSPRDEATQRVCRSHGVRCIVTDAMHHDGAVFNKGRALNAGLEAIDASDWILTLDADTVLAPDFRTQIRREPLDPEVLYGASRVCCEDSATWSAVSLGGFTWDQLPELPTPMRHGRMLPLGFFQLFHATSRTFARDPRYPDGFPTAAKVDTTFAKRWKHRRVLPIRVLHLGPTFENHAGRRSPRFG